MVNKQWQNFGDLHSTPCSVIYTIALHLEAEHGYGRCAFVRERTSLFWKEGRGEAKAPWFGRP